MRSLTVAASFAASVIAATAAAPPGPAEVAKLPPRPGLPNPLVMFDGTPVASKEDWGNKRRPELKALFARYMYGASPPAPAGVKATIDSVDGNFLGGKATKKEVTITFGPEGAPALHLLMIVPNGRKAPAPVFLGLNFYGNHTVVKDPSVALATGWVPDKAASSEDNRATEKGRGFQAENWQAETIVARGYALATFYCGDAAPDHPGDRDGLHPHYPGFDWGIVAAWAWGASRAADYLVTDADVDKARIAVVGHSRLGKAALLAGALDDRFALVFSHQAGCGGSAPSRGTVGESVKRINTSFPNWFNDAFKLFNDRTDRLPFDQNCLVALVAPRPVLFTNATEDTWANPAGQFEVLKAAAPVYKLLGAGGLGADKVPEPGKLVDTPLGYAIRPGKHSMDPTDWGFFLDYADKHFGRKAKTGE